MGDYKEKAEARPPDHSKQERQVLFSCDHHWWHCGADLIKNT
jgi:hypothetical protein